jgi:hypothetical protein
MPLNAHNSSLKKCIVHEMAKKKGNNANGVVTKKILALLACHRIGL